MNSDSKIKVGLKVRTIKPIDRFPDFLIKEINLEGTIKSVEHGVWVKMDKHMPELDEWDNCVCWPEGIEGGLEVFWEDVEVLSE